MKPLTILKKARALLDNPAKWCQGAFARAKNGNHIGPETKGAVQWCAVGAVRKVAGGPSADSIHEALHELNASIRGGDSIMVYNDGENRKHAQVLKVFDRAIERLEGEKL